MQITDPETLDAIDSLIAAGYGKDENEVVSRAITQGYVDDWWARLRREVRGEAHRLQRLAAEVYAAARTSYGDGEPVLAAALQHHGERLWRQAARARACFGFE